MRVFLEERDNLHIRSHLESLPNCELINIGQCELNRFVDKLIEHNIEVVVQIAPQWQWGKFVEEISTNLMKSGVKILAGEGAMFRWLGDNNECGADIGFYLSPWGYCGNSKLSIELPKYSKNDFLLAKKIMESTQKWDSRKNNGKILVSGQIENDRSRMYCKSVLSNKELIDNVLKFFPKNKIAFRKHPLDRNNYDSLGVELIDSKNPIIDIVHEYRGFVTINSTSTIEAMCCCVPVHNFEVAPWSSCKSISKGNTILLKNIDRSVVEDDIASLMHLHYIKQYNHGLPFQNALSFYSDYSLDCFNFNCNRSAFFPTIWNEAIRFKKY